MSVQVLAAEVLRLARAKGSRIVTAESCTGGMIAAALTDIAGASDVFDRGFVTYSNEAKQEILGVSASTLESHGAVSEQTALEMARGALRQSNAQISISVTGVAGPGGGTRKKPVGLVWFAIGISADRVEATRKLFPNEGRDAIRRSALCTALDLLLLQLTR